MPDKNILVLFYQPDLIQFWLDFTVKSLFGLINIDGFLLGGNHQCPITNPVDVNPAEYRKVY